MLFCDTSISQRNKLIKINEIIYLQIHPDRKSDNVKLKINIKQLLINHHQILFTKGSTVPKGIDKINKNVN